MKIKRNLIKLFIIFLMLGMIPAFPRTYYDIYGNRTGSFSTNGNSTTIYD